MKTTEKMAFLLVVSQVYTFNVFLCNHHVVPNTFNIVKETSSNLLQKILPPGVSITFVLRTSILHFLKKVMVVLDFKNNQKIRPFGTRYS